VGREGLRKKISIEIFIFGIFRIKLFILYIGQITFDKLDLLIISASKSFSGSKEEDQNVKS
jgi:hypothetical protein